MRLFLSAQVCAAVCCLFFVPAALAQSKSGHAQQQSGSESWSTHSDPAGFVVDLPSAWTVAKEQATGRIVLRGIRGEQAVIWPLFLEHAELDSGRAAILLPQLAHRVDAQMAWGKVQSTQRVVRTFASGGQRSATALLSWANGAGGASAYFYCLEAPRDVYHSSTDSFVRILNSFHIVQDPSLKSLAESAGGSGSGALSFVNWNDPREGAFSMAVPQGWRVIGGAYRLSATDVRYAVTMGSPDGQVRATVGDSNIGLFIPPSQMLAMAGLREGGFYGLGDGTRVEIRRYIPGPQFVRLYAQSFISRQCSGLQVQSNNARPDLVATFVQSARNEGVSNPYITAGDVSFTCNLNGRQVQGKYVAATMPFVPNQTSMWVMYRLYGYLAAAGRERDGEQAMAQALRSMKFNPQWEAQQRGIANAAVQQDNIRSQQIRSRAQQAIAEDQRQTSQTIMKGWEQRQKVYDEISRRRENAILGTLDVIDPQTGTQYKVSNFGDYHYMSNEGYIYSTNSPNSPGPNMREMITLPY
ncbi:MAG: hypothetical protein ACXVZM_07785 [Terriglobales bacterium]